MKNISKYLFLVLSLMYALNGTSQSEVHINAGITYSNIDWTNLNSFGWRYKSGFAIGGTYSRHIVGKIYFDGELQYVQKGHGGNEPHETFHYIDLAPTLTFRPIKYVGYSLGLNTGVLLNKESTLVEKSVAFGVLAGVKFNVGKFKVYGHYNHGLINLEDRVSLNPDNKITGFNSSFQVGIGYKIFSPDQKSENDPLIEIDDDKSKPIIDLGIRFSNLNNFNFIIKKEISSSQYARLRLLYSNAIFNRNKSNHIYSWQAGIAVGLENRLTLDERLAFIHGIEPSVSFSYQNSKDNFQVSINPAIGYLVGLLYEADSNFNFGIEAIPSITMDMDFDHGGLDPDWNLYSSIGNSSIALVVTYSLNRNNK